MGLYEIGCCAGEDDDREDNRDDVHGDVESPTEAVRAQIRVLRLAAASRRMEGNAALAEEQDDHADVLEAILKQEQAKTKAKTTKKKTVKKPVKKKVMVVPGAPGMPAMVTTKNIDDDTPGAFGFLALLGALGVGAYAFKKSRLRGV